MKDQSRVEKRHAYTVTLRMLLPEIAITGLSPHRHADLADDDSGVIFCEEREEDITDVVDGYSVKIRWMLAADDCLEICEEGIPVWRRHVPAEELEVFHNGHWELLIDIVA